MLAGDDKASSRKSGPMFRPHFGRRSGYVVNPSRPQTAPLQQNPEDCGAPASDSFRRVPTAAHEALKTLPHNRIPKFSKKHHQSLDTHVAAIPVSALPEREKQGARCLQPLAAPYQPSKPPAKVAFKSRLPTKNISITKPKPMPAKKAAVVRQALCSIAEEGSCPEGVAEAPPLPRIPQTAQPESAGQAKKPAARQRTKASDLDTVHVLAKVAEKAAAGQLGDLTIPEAKCWLKEKKLPVKGKKEDLVARIKECVAKEE